MDVQANYACAIPGLKYCEYCLYSGGVGEGFPDREEDMGFPRRAWKRSSEKEELEMHREGDAKVVEGPDNERVSVAGKEVRALSRTSLVILKRVDPIPRIQSSPAKINR